MAQYRGSLILFRGLPGSGKTLLASLLCDAICSADNYFTTTDGEYHFNPAELPKAHDDCRFQVENFMINCKHTHYAPIVGIHNTFTQDWEMEPYFELAKKYGWDIHTVVVENRHGSKSIHDVPEEAINRMRDRFSIQL